MTPRPILVLDSNALAERSLRGWLPAYTARKVLPAVAYTELGVHFRPGRQMGRLYELLTRCRIEVEWYRSREADHAIGFAHTGKGFRAHARDYMIGSHAAAPDRVLVTNNVKHFGFLERVMTPAEAMQGFE